MAVESWTPIPSNATTGVFDPRIFDFHVFDEAVLFEAVADTEEEVWTPVEDTP